MTMHKGLLAVAVSGLVVLGVAWCGVQAHAQAGPSGEHMGRGHRMGPDEELQRLDKTLKLTDDQKKQIKAILEDREQKMQSLRSDTSLSQQERWSKMRSAREDSNSKIRDLLNDDQKKKFDEMQQHERGHMQGHRPGGGAPPENPQ
jgi:Spy/CpxP family protein refolding chaperone